MEALFEKLATSIEMGQEEETVQWTQQALEEGLDPVDIIQKAFSKGIEECGDKYNRGIYFLPELMLTGEAMKAGLALLLPHLGKNVEGRCIGKVLMAAVEGDVHDIGKNICLSMLLGNGFEIVDAGVDVAAQKVVELVREHQPDIVGLGSYMSTTLPAVEEAMAAVRKDGFAGKVIVGGVAVNRRWAEEAGADGYAEDAWGCVDLCREIMGAGAGEAEASYAVGSDKLMIR
ncbi:MAG: corrinoid protein [Deferrisomatales bacterium]